MGIKSDLENNFDFEIVDEFLDHYSMMVESMEIMIIDLSKPSIYKRSVDELFRVFHTLNQHQAIYRYSLWQNLQDLLKIY